MKTASFGLHANHGLMATDRKSSLRRPSSTMGRVTQLSGGSHPPVRGLSLRGCRFSLVPRGVLGRVAVKPLARQTFAWAQFLAQGLGWGHSQSLPSRP